MRFRRKIMICVAALSGTVLGAASTADAQNICRHIGKWTMLEGRYSCKGDHLDGHCIWTDDCRVYAE
jgi:hypothetical protein